MARLNCCLDLDTTLARDFFWYADMVAKDIEEETKQRQAAAQKARAKRR